MDEIIQLKTAVALYQAAAERWQARAEQAERKLDQGTMGCLEDAGTSSDPALCCFTSITSG
jgi:hypothetical protein